MNMIKVRLDDADSQRIENVENLLLKISEQIDTHTDEEDRLIDINEVAKLIGFSVTTIKDKMKANLFPKPCTIFTRNRWSYLEVKNWIDEQTKKR